MKNCFSVVFSFAIILALSGCGGSPKSAGNNKWLDFGNGLINLTNVTNVSFGETSVKFDGFELTIASIEYTDKEKAKVRKAAIAKGLDVDNDLGDNFAVMGLPEFAEVQKEANERAKKDALRDFDRIRDFINSSSTYMKL